MFKILRSVSSEKTDLGVVVLWLWVRRMSVHVVVAVHEHTCMNLHPRDPLRECEQAEDSREV